MPDDQRDLVQIGANDESRRVLDLLVKHDHLKNQIDGYRLAVAVAIAHEAVPSTVPHGDRKTMFHAGALDETFALRRAIIEIYPSVHDVPNRAAEDLAEQGLKIIDRFIVDGTDISLASLVAGASESASSGANG